MYRFGTDLYKSKYILYKNIFDIYVSSNYIKEMKVIKILAIPPVVTVPPAEVDKALPEVVIWEFPVVIWTPELLCDPVCAPSEEPDPVGTPPPVDTKGPDVVTAFCVVWAEFPIYKQDQNGSGCLNCMDE